VPEYLSDAWIAALDGAVQSADTLDDLAPLVVEQLVTDVPRRGDVRYQIVITSTGARAVPGAAENATIRLTTDYRTAVAIARGDENAQIALAAGRLRLGGDLDALARRTGALVSIGDVTASLRSATTYPSP
jgi:hypothetical protein